MLDPKPAQVANDPADDAALSVFVSYSRRDKVAADALVAALEARGLRVFIDRRDLPYGEQWQLELADSIAGCDTVIWLVSPDSIGSKWCNWELDEVQKQHKRLVPVRVGAMSPQDLPRQLGVIHILPAEGLFEQGAHLDTLVQVLQTDRPWLKEHTRLLDRAQQWLLKERSSGLLLRGRALADALGWQGRQPPKAPPPSPEVLDLIVASQRGSQRRQRRLVASLGGGLAVAVALGGVAWWQSRVAVAEAQRVVRTTALSGWRAFQAVPPGCADFVDATGDEGLRSMYCRLRGTLSYAQLERLSGMPVFLSGPHGGGKLKLRADTFGHYNPAFVRWAADTFVPAPQDGEYVAVSQAVYDKALRQQARAYYRAYVAWTQHPQGFAVERAYLMDMLAGRRPWAFMGARWQDEDLKALLGVDLESEGLNGYLVTTGLRFWQRRSIDGTADDVFALLDKLLAVHDAAWRAKAPQPASPHLAPLDAPVTPPTERWLSAPVEPNDVLNKELVIE